MMRSVVLVLALCALASAFAPCVPLKNKITSRLSMLDTAGEDKPLEATNAEVPAAAAAVDDVGARKMLVKNLGFGKGGEVREVNFVDPAMLANTNPLMMNWWA